MLANHIEVILERLINNYGLDLTSAFPKMSDSDKETFIRLTFAIGGASS